MAINKRDMRIIRNDIVPFKGFDAINLFGILFARKDADISNMLINHEKIHTAQAKEMLFVFFYLWYGIEWIIRLICYKNATEAYYKVSFEAEAYENQHLDDYLDKRGRYCWIKYLL